MRPLVLMRRTRSRRLVLLTCLSILFTVLCITFHSHPDSHPLNATLTTASDLSAIGIQRVYLASAISNANAILRSTWIPSVLDLAKKFRNADIKVFISIYESGSWDGTKDALQKLIWSLNALGVECAIQMGDETHEDVVRMAQGEQEGWLRTLYGKEYRRIVYLAHVRNRALQPLADDVLTLLYTRHGEYAAACALDFLNPPPGNIVDPKIRGSHPAGIYDDFATRDAKGRTIGSHLFPYFRAKVSANSVAAGEPVPVKSCWGGLVAFNALPFQHASSPLRFRAIPDTLAQHHVEASECCLIHYDNLLATLKGVWINPFVRVGYSVEAYAAVRGRGVDGTETANWPTKEERRTGFLKRRWIWWINSLVSQWKIGSRVRKWQKQHQGAEEVGLECLGDLAMVLTKDGWALRGAEFE